MQNKRILTALAVLVLFTAAADYVPSSEAVKYTGKAVKVCGYAAEVSKEQGSEGNPWVIDLGRGYPNQEMSVIIWEKDEAKFGNISSYKGSSICVSGRVEILKTKPVMILKSPAQIEYYKPPKKPSKEELSADANAKVMRFIYKPRTIKMLKKIMADNGYVPGDMSENWTLDSHRTVIAYQKAKKLKQTGLIDKKTLEALQKDSAESSRIDDKTKRLYFDELEKQFEFW